MSDVSKIWSFVEEYYPNYSSSDEIAHNGDYYKIVDGEINGCAQDLYNEIEKELTEKLGYSPEEFQITEIAQNLLNESNVKIYEEAIEGYLETLGEKTAYEEVQEAKAILKKHGYSVERLWQVDDVKDKYSCTDAQAYTVLDGALANEATTDQIRFAIDMHADIEGLEKKEDVDDCEDCGDEYPSAELFPYKYEPGIKLCLGCLDNRMED